jgi:anaphase-promoting complex subunit 3
MYGGCSGARNISVLILTVQTRSTAVIFCLFCILDYEIMLLLISQRSEEALAVMEKAILADKKNLLPMYQKANILMGLERFDEALEVLEELKEYAPYESSVFALMGNIYKRRNMHERAMFHYGIALDLKPTATDAATIKVI